MGFNGKGSIEMKKQARKEIINTLTEKQVHAQIADYLKILHPDLIFRSDPAGLRLSFGMRKDLHRISNPEKGFPDILILEPIGEYHGLAVEVKKNRDAVYKKNGTFKKCEHLETQISTMERLDKKGYCTALCCGFEEAITFIESYLLGKINDLNCGEITHVTY